MTHNFVEPEIDSETELIINETDKLSKVKRPVGRPKIYLDPNHKYPNNYPRKNLYKHCDVCNKTCEYYHFKKHVKSKYHLKRSSELEVETEAKNETEDKNETEQEPEIAEEGELNSYIRCVFPLYLLKQSCDKEKFQKILESFDYKIEDDKIISEIKINKLLEDSLFDIAPIMLSKLKSALKMA